MNEIDELDELERELGHSLRLALRHIAAEVTDDGPTSSLGLTGDDPDDALRTTSTTVTLVDTEPTSTRPPRRRWLIVISAAAAVVAIVAGALAFVGHRDDTDIDNPAVAPAANGLIAVEAPSDEDKNGSEIFVVAPDGTGLQTLTSTPEFDEYAPVWSPDGTRLAFVRIPSSINLVDRTYHDLPCTGCQIVVVDPSTGLETFSADLPSASSFPGQAPAVSLEWSPDGQLIMVTDSGCGVGGCGGGHRYVVDLRSGAWTTTIPSFFLNEGSPDGRWRVVRETPGGDSLIIVPADLVGTGGGVDVDSDSLSGARRLQLKQGESPAASEWMPDSSALVQSVEQWESATADMLVPIEPDWNPRIVVIPIADGQRSTVIEGGFRPAVSPDGSQIAFMRGGRFSSGGLLAGRDVREIWVAAADGSEPRRVTTSLTPPTWSPDGGLLLLMDEQGWFTVRPDGSDRTVLPPIVRADPFRDMDGLWLPSWQPLPSS